jgi:Na+-driven multidrug efflux pump
MSTPDALKVSFITRDTRDTEEVSSSFAPISKKQQMEIEDTDSKTQEDTEVSWVALKAYAPKFFFESIPFMFNRMNPYLLNMISLVFVAFYGSATLTAGFGLGNAIFMFFWQTFTQVNGETQGIGCSKAFGAGDFKQMRLGFYRGLAWNYLVTVTSAVLYFYIDRLLLAAGFEAEMTKQAHAMVVSLIPALFLQTINEMIRNYLMSQKVAKPFVWINLISFSFFPFGGYYIIYASGWGIAGFGLFKFIVETLNCIGLCWAMKRYGHEESLKRESIREVFNAADMKHNPVRNVGRYRGHGMLGLLHERLCYRLDHRCRLGYLYQNRLRVCARPE